MSEAHFPNSPQPNNEPTGLGTRRWLLIAIGLLTMFVLVCGSLLAGLLLFNEDVRARLFGGAGAASGAPPEGPNKYAQQLGSGPVLIEDDFAQANARWEQSAAEIVDGGYRLSLDQDNYDSYGLFLGSTAIADFDLSVDVAQIAGSAISEYGIRFRQVSPGEHLMFSISGNGYYRLLRVSDETYTSVVEWTASDLITTGEGAVNRLRVVAEGNTITGFINDQEVLSYRDPAPTAGQLTLAITTFDEGGLVVRFDNLAGEARDEAASAAGLVPGPVDLGTDFEGDGPFSWSEGGSQIVDGSYEVFIGGPVQSWQQPLPTGASEVGGDFVLEVDATLLSGGLGSSGYGVIFGDGGKFDFFSLVILPEGAIGLFRNENGPNDGAIVNPMLVSAVNPGLNATNRIRIEARGNILSVSINGQLLGDLEFPSEVRFDGMAGVLITGGGGEVRARFDNFRLSEGE